ncbi:MAG: hypothetical protein AAFX41_01590 [Bacteroidota bacterium]
MTRFTPTALVAILALALVFSACDTADSVDPDPVPIVPDVLLVTTVPDQTGQSGSSFVQTISLDQGSVTHDDAYEQTFFVYAHKWGNEVIVTQNIAGDEMVRYVRGGDGTLTETGRMTLPAGGVGSNVVWASATRAYVSLLFAGQLIVFNPQTMEEIDVIDLNTLGIARNPTNDEDTNPEPGVMAITGGKLYVGLQQFVAPFASASGVDVAVFDAATGAYERVIRSDDSASPGRYGFNQTMFVDQNGDLYVYGIASFGFAPGQSPGFLRIKNGETEFDDYFLDTSTISMPVEGGAIGTLNGMVYGSDGYVYGTVEVLAGRSNPPNYLTDFNWQPVRFNLAQQTGEMLPLPAGNGFSTAVSLMDGRVLFGLSTETARGIYAYDIATETATTEPVVTLAGQPQVVLAFDD